MFSQVLLKSLPKSVLAPWRAVLTAGFPKVWANIPRLLVDPFVLDSRSFAPFRFRHDLERRPPMPRMNILNTGLQAANDRVLRLMDRLELRNLARRLPDQLHTSSDGQKFEVRVDCLNANYSFKDRNPTP